MNRILEFHDSKVLRVQLSRSELTLYLNGCVHESEGNPGVDSGVSYFQNVRIDLKHPSGEAVEGVLSDGIVQLDDAEEHLKIDAETNCPGKLSLTYANGDHVSIEFASIEIHTGSDKAHVESFDA